MDWKGLVKTVAPVLGTALGGPLGGVATKFIAGKLLGDENASEEDIAEFVTGASPEQLVRLRELDNEFKLEMRRLNVDVMKIDAADRDSARKLAGVNMKPHMVISAVYTTMYAVVLYVVITGGADIPEAQVSLVDNVIGVLTAAQLMIMTFWFGSSSGSKEKTAKMA